MLHVEEYRVLIRRAKEFLVEAEEALENKRFDLACFFAEQSLQLYLKAILIKLIGDYPRTHYFRVLVAKLLEILPKDKKEMISEFIRKNRSRISELEDAYIMARYLPKAFSKDDAQDLIDLVKQTISLIEKTV